MFMKIEGENEKKLHFFFLFFLYLPLCKASWGFLFFLSSDSLKQRTRLINTMLQYGACSFYFEMSKKNDCV